MKKFNSFYLFCLILGLFCSPVYGQNNDNKGDNNGNLDGVSCDGGGYVWEGSTISTFTPCKAQVGGSNLLNISSAKLLVNGEDELFSGLFQYRDLHVENARITVGPSQDIKNGLIYPNGQFVSNKSFTVYPPSGNAGFELKNSPSSSAKFAVYHSGKIYTTYGLKIASAVGNPEPILFIKNNEKLFKVDDKGKVWATEVEVLLAPIPDYVFEESYKKLTLNELEAYVNEEKHLPGIPSASEIEEDGIGLGEMQILQLEKIEELVLYVLELNNKIKHIEKENDSLSKELTKLKNIGIDD